MPKSGSKGVGKRNTGGGKSKKKANKQAARAGFEVRHIDQVWEDVREHVNVVTKPDGTRLGPVGTSKRVELDADLPGNGKHYCPACSRYFLSQAVLTQHERSKPHKRRIKVLKGPKPHSQLDADSAGSLGKPDNGPKLYRDPKAAKLAVDWNGVVEGLQRL